MKKINIIESSIKIYDTIKEISDFKQTISRKRFGHLIKLAIFNLEYPLKIKHISVICITLSSQLYICTLTYLYKLYRGKDSFIILNWKFSIWNFHLKYSTYLLFALNYHRKYKYTLLHTFRNYKEEKIRSFN